MKTKKSKIVTIRVTKQDIRKGIRGNVIACPVALACSRRLKHKIYIRGDEEIEVDGDGTITSPKSVERFVQRFDDLEPVKPFSFKLKLTPEHREFLGL